jgi:hypothetical protein
MRDGGMATHRARIDGGHGGEADFRACSLRDAMAQAAEWAMEIDEGDRGGHGLRVRREGGDGEAVEEARAIRIPSARGRPGAGPGPAWLACITRIIDDRGARRAGRSGARHADDRLRRTPRGGLERDHGRGTGRAAAGTGRGLPAVVGRAVGGPAPAQQVERPVGLEPLRRGDPLPADVTPPSGGEGCRRGRSRVPEAPRSVQTSAHGAPRSSGGQGRQRVCVQCATVLHARFPVGFSNLRD